MNLHTSINLAVLHIIRVGPGIKSVRKVVYVFVR